MKPLDRISTLRYERHLGSLPSPPSMGLTYVAVKEMGVEKEKPPIRQAGSTEAFVEWLPHTMRDAW